MILNFKSNTSHCFLLFLFFIMSLALSTFLFPSNVFGQYVCNQGNCVSGFGKKTVLNGKAYMEGTFVEGTLREGKVLFPNGDIFQGKFENNKLLEGQKIFKDGRKLEGKFEGNVLVNGKITYMDGTSSLIQLKKLN